MECGGIGDVYLAERAGGFAVPVGGVGECPG